MVSIIVLNWNTLNDTLECVRSILEHTHSPFELILIDNGSTDGSQEYFQTACQLLDDPRTTYVANPTNRGFAGGCNQGIALAKGDYICLLNSDTVVTHGWLEAMRASLERVPKTGLVGPITDAACIPNLQGSHRIGDKVPDFATTTRLPFFCVLMQRDVVQRVGPLDERFGLGNYEDDDYCRRLRDLGYHFVVCGSAFVYHKVSRTFAANGIDNMALQRQNHQLFNQKWDS